MSISTMKKLVVITPNDCADSIVRRLIRLKCVEVRNTGSDECGYLLEKMDCDAQRSEAERRVAILDKIIPELTKYSKRISKLGDNRIKVDKDEFLTDGRYEDAWQISNDAYRIINRISECQVNVDSNNTLMSSLVPWNNLGYSLKFKETEKTDLIIGSMPPGTLISTIDDALSDIYAAVEFVDEDENGVYVSVVSMKDDTARTLKTLSPLGFVKIDFKNVEKTPKKALASISEENAKLDDEINSLKAEFEMLAQKLSDVEILYDIENTVLREVINKQKMAKTENCAVLVGWVPESRREKIVSTLDSLYCAYELEEPSDGEDVPVLLHNNKFAENFEWVIGMYSYPKYGSYDPTFIMSLFYFVIFGMMFADVGYGLILTVAGFLIPHLMGMKKSTKQMFNMFGYCGISCMLMGVVFGGWFGDLPYAIMQNMAGIENAKELYPFFDGLWFNPLNDPMAFLVVSLAAGLIHLVAGMAIKFVLLCKEGKVFDAIFDIGSWWVIFAGIAVIFLVGNVPGFITVGVGVLMIVLTHGRHEKNIIMKFLKGLLGLYDVTSYASDLLSYSRILALGLAAGVIAQVVNLVGTMGGASVTGFIALVIACLVGHTLNLAINVLGSFVHTSRLQYLEFFNKFYEDGGRNFEAVEPSDKYTID